MDFAQQILANRQALILDLQRRCQLALRPFADDLSVFLGSLLQSPLPTEWRLRLHEFVAEQAANGFRVDSRSIDDLAVWIERRARRLDELRGIAPQSKSALEVALAHPNLDERDRQKVSPGAAVLRATPPLLKDSYKPDRPLAPPPLPEPTRPAPGGGDQSKFATEAEEIVADEIKLPLNKGPNPQTIPGTGPGGIRVPDFKVRGPDGSVRARNTVVEVKASEGNKFGNLSQRSRQQIEDAIKYIEELRKKATLVKNPALKAQLENAHVEVFSDLPKPTRGRFAEFIKGKLLDWKPIPRESASVAESAIRGVTSNGPVPVGKPGLGTIENIALGIAISFIEAGVANAAYRDSAAKLADLLNQIAENGEADEDGWSKIQRRLEEINNMKQSWLGYAFEFISYGQGSLVEKQAMMMGLLSYDLADQYGYLVEKTWTEMLDAKFPRFVKKK